MKKGLIITISVVVVLLLAVMASYNGLVTKREEVKNKYADVSVQLERRADLIPNLVNTVKGYASHEEAVIKNVTDARAKLVGATSAQEKFAANEELSSALNRLLVVVENYPELKANTNFTQLQDELAGTENRIAVARRDYNGVVKSYNTEIKRFPKNIIAGMFGFESEVYFEAKESANDVPNVSF